MSAHLLGGSGAPEWSALPLAGGGCMIALGLGCVIAGLTGSDRFFETPVAVAVVSLVGVGGARFLLLLVGAALAVGGYLLATAPPTTGSAG